LNSLTNPGESGVNDADFILHSPPARKNRFPRCLEFSLLHGFLDGFLNQLGIPVVVEGLFGTDYGFDKGFQFVVAGFADIPVGQVKIVPAGNRGFNCTPANVASKGLHKELL
jgi:hypothetical protein